LVSTQLRVHSPLQIASKMFGLFLLLLASAALAQDNVPTNPSIDPARIMAAVANRPSVDISCSEAVDVVLQGSYDPGHAVATNQLPT
jgi:hypothetical protein